MSLNPDANSHHTSSTSSSSQPQSDSPITLNVLSQMLGQLFQQVTQQQQETIAGQVAAAVEANFRNRSSHSSSSSSFDEAKAPIMSSPLPSKVKVCVPSTYNGRPTQSVEMWLFEVKKYLQLCDVKSESQKVDIASGYFKDGAMVWWKNYIMVNEVPTDWNSFAKAVKHRFLPLAASLTARAQLYNLRQGTSSITDHSNKFMNLVQLADDMNEKDQIFLYIRSLRPAISREIDTNNFKSLFDAMTDAQRAETFIENRRFYNPSFEPRTTTNSTTSTYTSSGPTGISSSTDSSSAPTAMELGNMNSVANDTETSDHVGVEERVDEYQRYLEEGEDYEPNYDVFNDADIATEETGATEHLQAMRQRTTQRTAPYLPQEEFARCMRERLCLRCKKPNHVARNCPLRPRTFNSSQSQSQSSSKRNHQNFH
jgi:hypothetical protein